ncbi:oligosaccharide flippase family protein [Thermomonas sp.]|uniref:oligosaccharide flippase family protein n=1 Tax=Thermomonas sp. TaxID=1971895 RepID=UPI00260FE4C3|nr:oligosaccharide flippase family protein [Thermomonas sp.]MCO5054646.1 oligosaccharide flippase family protein [Thermomonas sp.]
MVKAVTGSAGLRIAGMGLGFLVGVQLARGLGVENYGIYGVAVSLVSLLGVPTEFGLPQLVTREVAARRARGAWSEIPGVHKWAVRTIFIISAITAALALLWTGWRSRGGWSVLETTVAVGLCMIPFVAIGKVQGGTLRGLHEIVKGQIPDSLVRPAAYSILLFFLFLFTHKFSPVQAMGAGVVSTICACIVGAFMLRGRLLQNDVFLPSQGTIRGWYGSALPMALTRGMRVLQGNVVIVILGMMVSTRDVGLFRIASSILVMVGAPVAVFTLVAAPIITDLYSRAEIARLQKVLAWVSFGMVVATAILVIPFFLFGAYLLGRIFGQEYSGASGVLMILCLGALFTASAGTAGTLLTMTKYEKLVTRATALFIAVLCFTVPVFTYLYSIHGAAFASVLSITFWRYLLVHDCKKFLGLDTTMRPLLQLYWQNKVSGRS